MPVEVVRVADRVAGTAIERLTNAHHARRLGKLGRSAQRTPPEDGYLWAAGEPPPRAGNALEVLIDGASYFLALEQAIRCARRGVLIAGWCNTPGFALVRDEPPVLLRELLGEAAESVDVRVLLWAGAPVPVFTPRRASVRAGRDQLVRGTRIKAALDSNERPMHCHHEKLVVIDKGMSKKFLDDSKTREMSRRVKRGFTAIGVFGHLARMVVTPTDRSCWASSPPG